MPNFTQISYSVCILIIRFLALNLPEAEDSGCVARGFAWVPHHGRRMGRARR